MKNYQKLLIYSILLFLGAIIFLFLKNSDFFEPAVSDNETGTAVTDDSKDQPNPAGSGTASSTIDSDIEISEPAARQVITSPLVIKGQARGSWFFEAIFSAQLIDLTGKELGRGSLTAKSDWMTDDFVPFEGEIEFINPGSGSGQLIFKNANPSGLPEKEKQFIIPVAFGPASTTIVKIYFNNNKLDPAVSCDKVFEVSRTIGKTTAPAREAISELLKGPAETETKDGYYTNINRGVILKNITIESGVARVDFSGELDKGVAGSCKVTAIRAQITQTLLQFPTVKDVVIAVEGRTADILQP